MARMPLGAGSMRALTACRDGVGRGVGGSEDGGSGMCGGGRVGVDGGGTAAGGSNGVGGSGGAVDGGGFGAGRGAWMGDSGDCGTRVGGMGSGGASQCFWGFL